MDTREDHRIHAVSIFPSAGDPTNPALSNTRNFVTLRESSISFPANFRGIPVVICGFPGVSCPFRAFVGSRAFSVILGNFNVFFFPCVFVFFFQVLFSLVAIAVFF